MAVIVNRKQAQYATSGFIAMRGNPDGTMAHAQRVLGFAGVIDITPILDPSNTVEMQVKVGRAAWEKKTVDFSGHNPAELTPEEAADALTLADFTGVLWSVDDKSGRLKVKASSTAVDYVQLYGKCAAALNFGGCRYTEGLGVYFKDYFTEDDTITIQPAVQQDENAKVEQEGSHGTKTTIVTAGGRNGEDLTITTKPLDFEFQQMVQGGKYKPATQTSPAEYEPPLPGAFANQGHPTLTIIKFDPLYRPNSESTEGQEIAMKAALYYNGIGKVGDESGGAKSLTQFQYTFNFGVYTDENGEKHANPKHISYTDSQWEAFQIKDLLTLPDEE